MTGVKVGNKPPDVWECFECNKAIRAREEIVACPFCGSDEIFIVR